ncbi:Protein phosphatase methylesterase 1 [Entophlyctis luteolus]|nr:Protein phosphatase methylesterase 1 [Entophlyctis luteolus]
MSTAAPAGAASLLAPVVRDLRTDSASDANGDVFRVYEWRAPVPAPVSGDSDVDTPPAPAQVPKAPLIVMHHGAGSSALSFSLAAVRLAQLLAADCASVVAYDARGHGATLCSNETLDMTQLVADLVTIVAAVRRDESQEVVLVGHSMGGSVVVTACPMIKNVVGTAVIDVVEGKFQVVVIPESWHYVQEDVPDKLAATLAEFWTRNQRLVIIKRFPIPPKPSLGGSTTTLSSAQQ